MSSWISFFNPCFGVGEEKEENHASLFFFFFFFKDSKSLFSPRFGLGEELEDSESLFSPRQFWIGGRMRGQNHSSIHVLDWVKNEI